MLGTCTFHPARTASLREAAEVLRTDRRTRREESKAQVHAKAWLLHLLKHYVMKGEAQPQSSSKPSQEAPKSLQNRAQSHQNQAWERPCEPSCDQEGLKSVQQAHKRQPGVAKKRPKAKVGSILEAQDPPKSRPRREKIDVKKGCIVRFDFSVIQTSFWVSFFYVFWRRNARKSQQCVCRETLENINFA